MNMYDKCNINECHSKAKTSVQRFLVEIILTVIIIYFFRDNLRNSHPLSSTLKQLFAFNPSGQYQLKIKTEK